MKRLRSLVMAVITVFVAVAYILPVTPALADSSASLSIAPKKSYIIDSGDSVEDRISIRNLDNAKALELSLKVIDFTYTDDGGTPKLMLDPNAEPTAWSLRPYLTIPESVSIAPGSSKTIDLKVSIPANRGAGSLYSAIIYSSGSGEGGNVGLSASGVTLVFADIPGKVDENLQLEQFGPYDRDKKDFFWFSAREPEVMGFTLKNTGNVTEAPIGSISLKSMWGQDTKITNLNPNNSLALIGQTRTFTSCIKDKEQDVDFQGASTSTTTCVSAGLWPGWYTASIDLYYGQNGNTTQEITKTITFWYLPWWFVALVLAIVGTATFYIRKFVMKVRSAVYGPQNKSRKRSSRR